MRATYIFLTVLVSQVYSAPQFITFKEGKLGVNFGGYHAGVGLGGLLGGPGGGAGGGLFAEAGTPHGQAARAGLGGNVHQGGEVAGGHLYAGATAGGNVGAATGLRGMVAGGGATGQGFATAEGLSHHAAAGLAGETNVHGSAGVSYSGTKSFAAPTTIIKETEVSVLPVETVKHTKIHKEFNVDALNEITPVAAAEVEANAGANVNLNTNSQPTVVVKEVYIEPQPKVIEQHIIHTHTKPHHHVQKTAYIGGFIGAGAEAAAPQPVIQKRIDVGAHSSANAGAVAEASANGGGQVSYTKEVTVSNNPTFFQDIFNIPISALKAVSSFLSNTAGSTNVSVQKSATVHTDSDIISPKHASPVSSSSSSEAHISVETPSASQLIDGIFSIPINTLGAVNKFLDNNVPLRKRIQVTHGESEEPSRVRLGPHARRRANKRVILEGADNSGSK